ncbi:tonB-dependent Receptor Plug domain protein [Novosphingobium sp. Rr 2-17]|uniref:TonB-dependent receptor plug domain-containing protein n=1 Tax=Novosphingobium sp. Rr 2-17 TaxID=555793 RepID=UPI0002698F14|nr:TonB-dependent receptor [Novosphingobium sp. Rr 2-17]EIZ78170.1 tonB-dependent Receptor Plug domain protein [Novosphingobium sp. Rr 2-17]
MKPSDALLLAATSVAAIANAQSAFAQDRTPEAASDNLADTIIVTGTRSQGRSKLSSASPVDVVTAQDLRQQGTTELGTALANIVPSIDFPRPSATDGTDAIRPATLRGMSPDQTLVLINGVRAHTSAQLNTNGSVGRGSAAVDLNTIPSTALESIEVLRDGASAQYGSDAIAGVINLRLRKADSGGGATVTYGIYDTQVDTARDSRHVTGESTVTVAGWQGAKLGQDGFITISGEYTHRNPTSRGDVDPRLSTPVVDNRFGDPEVTSYSGYVNAAKPIGDVWEIYGFGGYQYRNSTSAAFPRLDSAASAYGLDGFLPKINTHSRDLTATGGLRGEIAGWNADINLSYGRNKISYWTRDSANYTYGAGSQTDFYDGNVIYDQWVLGADFSKKFDIFQSLNVAWGVEGRREGYQINAGEYASYGYGTAYPTASPGAQGFGGFSPDNEVNEHRTNGSIYLDLEAQVTDKLLIGLAGRGEHYSDFGNTVNGKASARYDFSPAFGVRATASTGFRAPSLIQQYYTSVSSVIQNGNQVDTGTYPSNSSIAGALGGKALEPEKSTNLSAGFVVRSGGFSLTVDGYRIHVRNQLGLSENLSTSNTAVAAALTAYKAANPDAADVSAVRFFINGLATTTKGIDAVANYKIVTNAAGTFDLTLAGNLNDIDVTKVPTTTSTLPNAPTLFARSRILTIEKGTPRQKVTGSVAWSLGGIGATARVTYYGDVLQPGTTAAADIHTGKRAITDFELRYQPKESALNLAIGANNLLDVYPKQTPASLNTTGVTAFPYYSPFGFNGRYIYVRAGLNW